MEPHEELLGADLVEHGIRKSGVGVSRAISALGSHPDFDIEAAGQAIGTNPGKYIYAQVTRYVYIRCVQLQPIKLM